MPPEDEQYFGRIYFHRLGNPQAQDVLVFETPDEKEVVPLVHVTADDRYVVITAQRGASDDSEVYLIDRERRRRPRPLFTGFDAAYDFIEAVGRSAVLPHDAATRLAGGSCQRRSSASRTPTCAKSSRKPRIGSRPRSWRATGCRRLPGKRQRPDRALRRSTGSPRGRSICPGLGSIVTIDAEPDRDEVVFVVHLVHRSAEGMGGARRLGSPA